MLSHIIVVVMGTDNNKSTNKCTFTNIGIRSTIINFEHNRELTFHLVRKIIYSTNRSNGSNSTNYSKTCTYRSYYSTIIST